MPTRGALHTLITAGHALVNFDCAASSYHRCNRWRWYRHL